MNEYIELNIHVVKTANGHALELKKRISNREQINKFIEQALDDKPIIAKVILRNKLFATMRLREVGLI